MKIKVCGMTDRDQVAFLAAEAIDYAGFIFYKESPRYVLLKMSEQEVNAIQGIQKVGVFVNAPLAEVLRLAETCGLHLVQLHGDETPEYCAAIQKNIPVVKAFRLGGNQDISGLMQPYAGAADYFLFDTQGAAYGGTGKKFDWQVLEKSAPEKPFFLSGGIGAEDGPAIQALAHSTAGGQLFSLDINSRFETAPGVKDLQAVTLFARSMRK